MVLHTGEDNHPWATRRLDLGFLHLKVRANAHRLDLVFQQALDGHLDGLLDFPDTDRVLCRVHDVFFDDHLAKAPGFPAVVIDDTARQVVLVPRNVKIPIYKAVVLTNAFNTC